MSYHHANVVWQSADGTWSRGFYADLGCSGGCYDEEDGGDETHEWCRDFDYGSFEWVSTGHPSEDAAYRSWNGSNPGGNDGVTGPEEAERLDDMAAAKCEEARASSSRYVYGYEGPPRTRKLKNVQAERLQHRLAWAGHRLGGYGNMLDTDRDNRLLSRCKELLATAPPAERDAYWDAMAEHARLIRAKQSETAQRRADQRRTARPYGYSYYDTGAAARIRQQEAYDAEVEAWATRIEAAVTERQAKVAAQSASTRAATASTATPSVTGTARRKTTAKSNSGSFATPAHAENPTVLDGDG